MKNLNFLDFPHFWKDTLLNKKIILHELLQEIGHVVWLIHGLKGVHVCESCILSAFWKKNFGRTTKDFLTNFTSF